MSFLILAVALVAPPPKTSDEEDHHPSLTQVLILLDRDAAQLQKPDLAAPERARLALEIRAQAERLRVLAEAQPTAVKQLALDVQREAAEVAQAAENNLPVSRRAGELAVSIHSLRSVLGP